MTYIDAFAEWDDPHAFRVYLSTDIDEDPIPMCAEYSGTSVEARLYRAAFVACPKDLGSLTSAGGPLGWPKAAPAKRVAAAVRKELGRIKRGLPGVSNDAIKLAMLMSKGSRR